MRSKIVAGLIVVATSVFGLTGVAQAATVHVRCRTSSLISALNAANATSGTKISLARGCVYELHSAAVPGTGLPVLTSAMTIVGNGATVVRKSSSQFRILKVSPGGEVTIRHLTIKGGRAVDGVGTDLGGGILNEGTLTLAHVTVAHNVSGNASGGGAAGGLGGGIFNDITAELHLIGSHIVANRTGNGASAPTPGNGGNGGGIYTVGILMMDRTTIAHNVTGSGGGAPAFGGSGAGLFVNSSGEPVIRRSLITRNRAGDGAQGGGIFNNTPAAFSTIRTKIVRNLPNNCSGPNPVENCTN